MRLTFLLFGLLFGLLASAAALADLEDELAQCRSISDDAPRLVCYDAIGAVGPGVGAIAPESAAVSTTTAEEEGFGLEYDVKDAQQQIVSTVVAVRKNAKGGLVVTLANDQIWQQSGSERLYLDEGDPVTIHRGALSAFFLSVDDKGRRYRFSRVR